MKKINVILAVMLLISIAVSSWAQAPAYRKPDATLKTAVWVGTTANGPTPTNYTGDAAPTVGSRIYGFRVTGSSNPVAGLYDAASLTTAINNALFDEGAAASNSESINWYPAPKVISTGFCVINNASTTVTTVYYE